MKPQHIIGIFVIVLCVLVGTPTQAGARTSIQEDQHGEDAQLCPVGEEGAYRIIEEFPYIMNFKNSRRYPEGPRSCTFRDKHPLTYWCEGGHNDAQTRLNVVSNSTSKRLVFKVTCDGERHYGDIETMYGTLAPPYHVHWHMYNATWKSAYLEVT